MSKKNISNYPFGKNIEKPNTVYTQDIFGNGAGITGRKKKNKKNFVSNKSNAKEDLLQSRNKK